MQCVAPETIDLFLSDVHTSDNATMNILCECYGSAKINGHITLLR